MTPKINMRIEILKNGGIPEGYKKTKYGVFPSNWKIDKLGNYLTEYRELSNDIEKNPVYSSSRKGLLPQSQYYDKREAVTTNLGYKIVPDGYVTYRHMSDDDIFHFNQNTTGDSVLVSSEYPVFSCNKNCNLYFIITLLNESPRFRHYCRMQKMGGTRTRLYYKNLCHYITCFPSLEEQQRIASILSAQDKVIECYEKKIEQLKQMKKYYLQNMFPKRGEKVPKIRFKCFFDSWKQHRFDEFVSFFSGLTYSPADIRLAGTLVLRSSNVKDGEVIDADNVYVDPAIVNSENVQDGDIIVVVRNGSRALIGKHAEIKGFMPNTVIGAFMTGIRSKHPSFLNALLNTPRFDKEVKMNMGATINQITGYMFSKMEFLIPSPKEQNAIGEYFRKLDNLIVLHQRLCDEEKKKKKALQQLLLTGIVRV